MKIRELTESATSILYHFCSPAAGLKIVESGVFKLSISTGTRAEAELSIPGYPYFLSLTRSLTGDYHRYVGNSACMFVIDGNWLNSRYKTKPVDYWQRAWNHDGSDRTRESEDRVFSKQPTIPVECVKAIHLFLREQENNRSSEVRGMLIAAKKRSIPVYLYNSEKAWRTQDTTKAIKPSENKSLLRGSKPVGYHSMRRDYVKPWLELIHKTNKEQLSKPADKLRYNITYYTSNMERELAQDISYARKPNAEQEYESAKKIVAYLTKYRLTTEQLIAQLKDKWKDR